MTDRLHLSLRPERRQIMAFALHQSLQILQMSQLELAERIQAELERNPVLEQRDRTKERVQPSLEPQIPAKTTLREHLLRQMRDTISDETDQDIAKYLIDQLDERGFLTTPFEEMPFARESILRVLLILQSFDPPGIAARGLQESLWLQLRGKSPLCETIVRNHFSDLLQGRFTLMQKILRVSMEALQKAVRRIARLRLRPAAAFDNSCPQYLVPDLIIQEIDQGFLLKAGDEELPVLQLRPDYVEMVPQLKNQEEKTQLRGWITGAKWLQRCIQRRRDVLLAIGRLLIRREGAFFSENGEIAPIVMQHLAKALRVHPSTAWRAVANKTLACPRGLVPLRQFFCESSNDSIKDLLRQWIQNENRSQPLTDLDLVRKLQETGICCARRTIAKYRRNLQIASAARRKVFGRN